MAFQFSLFRLFLGHRDLDPRLLHWKRGIHWSIRGLVPLLFIGLMAGGCSTLENPWAKVPGPSRGTPESIGGTSSGCLKGGRPLAATGTGYQVMRPSRRRFYGHSRLIQFIERLGALVAQNQLGGILVGDLSQPRGGPMPGGHVSHQNGLDVDIWFWRPPWKQSPLSDEERETWWARSMLIQDLAGSPAGENGIPRLDPQLWNQEQEEILRITAGMEEVERIFVNPHIKKALCQRSLSSLAPAPLLKLKRRSQSSTSGANWEIHLLRKIRPWWGHDDHFHVRLTCAKEDTLCQTQAPLPPGDGCDQSLEWWFQRELEKEREEEHERRWRPWTAETQGQYLKGESLKTLKLGRQWPRTPPACEPILEELEASKK